MTVARRSTPPPQSSGRKARRRVRLAARPATGLVVALTVAGCGVSHGAIPRDPHPHAAAPVVKLSDRPCAIQTIGLLTAAQMPPHLTAQWPAKSALHVIG